MAVKPGNGGNGERDPRLDLLYRDAAREAPPARLDAAIRAAARREVGARPRSVSEQFRRWRVPVSIAAVVVLSVSLVTLVSEEGGESLLRDERLPASPPAAPMAASPEQLAGPAKTPEVRKRASASAPEELSLRRDEAAAEAEPRREAEQEPARSSAAPAAGSLRLDEGPPKATAVPKSTAERDVRPSAEPAAGPETTATPPAAAIGGLLSSQSQESAPRPAADAPQRQAPVGVRGSAADTAPPATAPKPMTREKRMQVEERAKPLAYKRPPVWQGLEQEPPQKWLERLAELKRQGRTGEANELLAELKRRFPHYPLPSGLE